jgi:hypothetical protein
MKEFPNLSRVLEEEEEERALIEIEIYGTPVKGIENFQGVTRFLALCTQPDWVLTSFAIISMLGCE